MASSDGGGERLDWELATESIVVKIRWFGIVMGVGLVQARSHLHDPMAVRACLALGAVYAALDTLAYRRGGGLSPSLAALRRGDGVDVHRLALL